MARSRRRPAAKDSHSDNGHSTVKDAVLSIKVEGGELDGQEIEMDVMLVRLASDELARKHNLEVVDGELHATVEFVAELCERIKQIGYPCTPSVAIHAWVKVSEYFAELQKKTS